MHRLTLSKRPLFLSLAKARNSSFTYKGRPVDVKQVGRELGVRYVLEGSVRKSANHEATRQCLRRCASAVLQSNRTRPKFCPGVWHGRLVLRLSKVAAAKFSCCSARGSSKPCARRAARSSAQGRSAPAPDRSDVSSLRSQAIPVSPAGRHREIRRGPAKSRAAGVTGAAVLRRNRRCRRIAETAVAFSLQELSRPRLWSRSTLKGFPKFLFDSRFSPYKPKRLHHLERSARQVCRRGR